MRKHVRPPEPEDAHAGHVHPPSTADAPPAWGRPMTPNAVLALQRTVGNAAVAAALEPVAVQRTSEGGTGQGPLEDKPMDGLSRLRRANQREVERGQASRVEPGQGTSPFGNYTVQSGYGHQGYITSNNRQHPRSSSVGTFYVEVFAQLQQQHLPLVAEALRGRALDQAVLAAMTATEKRAAAVLYGLIRESENARTPGAVKAACSALDEVGATGGGWQRFRELFPLAQEHGAQVYNTALAGQNQLSAAALANLEDMSSSSDEQSS